MAIAFTPEQEQVIQLHNRNILVSAAAGSGKTAVLVERIVRMVCDEEHPVDIDRLLIVTFTNAAAAEMRERISLGIADQLKEHPESEHIQKQATLLHNAQITTIDSFCLFIIRNHFHEIGLDPAFRVADDSEIKLLEKDVLAELLEEAFESKDKDEDFFHCVEFFCPGGRESVLENYILKLSHHAASCPFPEEWLEARKEDYAAKTVAEFVESEIGLELKRYINQMLDGCIYKLKEVQQLCQSPDGPYMYGEIVDKELEALEKLRRLDSLEEYSARVPNVEFGRLPTKKDESVSPIKREMAKELRSQVKDILAGLGEDFFKTPLELSVVQSGECDRAVKKLVELTLEFDRRMKAEKLEKKMIDFSDMEHYALEILLDKEDGEVKPSRVAREYRQHFHEILIDEYQDSNLVQEFLLKAVSGEEDGKFNRFMVGDVKQSIYRFRLARPELFQEKYNSYELGGSENCRIDLSRNFRSRSQVVDTVNSVFEKIMGEETGGLVYDENAALYTGAVYPETEGCESEFLIIEKPGREDEMGGKEAEALAIAHRIHELKREFQVSEKNGTMRPVKYSDMVILLRSNQGWDDVFKRVLEAEGIPVYITSKTGYFAATEVQELLQVLRVLDNPRQDIPLYGLLKSVFVGFSEEEIAQIRAGRKKCTLYEALCEIAMPESEDVSEGQAGASVDGASGRMPLAPEQVALSGRAQDFLNKLRRYREYTVYMPIRELLQQLVEDHDYLNYVTALPAGSKRKANVEMLFTKASDFEKTSYFGLFHFVRYMEQLEKYDVDYGEAGLLDENADVVRIMSIHKSKGLEFPVTFVAGLSKRFNLQEYSQSLVVDMDFGLGTTYVNPTKRIKNKTLRQQVLARRLKLENFAEELRILYVALTRAREKLILTATLSKAVEKWEVAKEHATSKLSFCDFAHANTYLDFLMPVLAKTDLHVDVKDAGWMEEEELGEQLYMADKAEALKFAGDYADEDCVSALRQKLSFVYPYQNLEKLYTKTTVSELKASAMAEKDEAAFHAFEEREVVPYIPAFRRDKEEVSGTVRGNAFHRAMELMDFEAIVGDCFGDAPVSHENYVRGIAGVDLYGRIRSFLEKEVAAMHLSQEYFDALNLKKLEAFVESEFAWRMWAADRRGELYREQPFVLGVEAERVSAEFPEEETVLIQGIIDVFWVEDGEIVLLDYKTDVIGSMDELRNRYETQLEYYQEALERLMGMRVKDKVLYSFYLQRGC